MSVLSAQSIRKRNIFQPFCERSTSNGMTYGLGPSGYDVRIAESVILNPQQSALASTIEHFNIPIDCLAYVKDKSTWARQFILLQNTVIEPGWRGYLTLEITNDSNHTIRIAAGSPIAQIVFHMLDEPTEIPYDGKYQDQSQGAQPPILAK